MTQPSFPPLFLMKHLHGGAEESYLRGFSPQININTIQGWLIATKLGIRGPGFLFSSSLSSCVTWAKSFNNSVSSRKWEFSNGTVNTCAAYLRVWAKRKMRLLKSKRHGTLFDLELCWLRLSVTWCLKQAKYFREYLETKIRLKASWQIGIFLLPH